MKVGLLDLKQALMDPRFRDSLPIELKEDVSKFLTNPGCACNVPLYRRLFKDYSKYIKAYWPEGELVDEAKEVQQLAKNNFTVINCPIVELETRLKKMSIGRKQIAIARYEDQVTVIVNHLETVF